MTAPTVTKTVPWRYRGSTEARARAAEHLAAEWANRAEQGPEWVSRRTLALTASSAAGLAALTAEVHDDWDQADVEREAGLLLRDMFRRANAIRGGDAT